MLPPRPIVVALLALTSVAGCTASTSVTARTTTPTPTTATSARSASPRSVSPRTTAPPTAIPTTTAPRSTRAAPTRHAAARTPSPTSTAPRPQQLPLDDPTHAARQVITVVAGSRSDTTGRLQAWRRVHGGWRPVGRQVPAWLGSDGMTDTPNEQTSATPMGSFTLTQAFGHDSAPGTRLPYRHTDPDDWWISEPGDLYNTLQHCVSDCAFAQGSPNEHLYYETPYYDYAVVIDYNRDPVRQGAGSAFFLHVTVGAPTQGCVSIDRDQLVRILRWLDPAEHPRILIGTG